MQATEGEILAAQHGPGPELEGRLRTLHDWLVHQAYPRWAQQGYDRHHGGFQELLDAAGPIVGVPRRARVQVRQLYAFSRATELGWAGDLNELMVGGWEYFYRHYRRADGLYRTLVAPDGTVLDDRAFLYDQAFVLLALAESHRRGGPEFGQLAVARHLRGRLFDLLKCAGPGYRSGLPEGLPLLSNPHMHLLEAVQSWALIDADPAWQLMADEIIGLALGHMIDPRLGALFERFDEHWRALSSDPDHLVEPGHQFEWAWLLLRSRCLPPSNHAIEAATRLVDVGETCGIRGGVAVVSLHADLSVHDGQARLWAQTERLKAALALARLTHDSRYWNMATLAAHSLWRYVGASAPGLWRDRLTAEGELVAEPAPASSLYHLVVAIAEGLLDRGAA
jgi:mannose/cellobiose epimerase-like protein (N-acyl-D-glucosamine 2-epimerase family)